MEVFHPATAAWFADNFPAPTAIQRQGWPKIASGAHALLIAPTGSGKTLAAFLYGIDQLMQRGTPQQPGVQLLYISPLKALVHDIERNLRGPLAGIVRAAAARGEAVRPLQVDVRTGDTHARDRERQRRNPGDIMVTTPESLFLMLGSRYRENFRAVRTVIVDEVHALAPVKRGTHLALSLERLSSLCEQEPQRVGLSATVRPAALTACFLGGDREVEIVDCAQEPHLDLEVMVPVPDMENVPFLPPTDTPRGGPILAGLYAPEVGTPPSERGIWSAIYPALLEHILANRSTIVFVNSRGLCERLSARLNELAGEDLVRAHHGSVSHEARTEIEDALKRGELRAIVATSSLELGIDMGAVDLVLQVESPGAVARGLQRVGRAGHQVQSKSKGRIYPKFRGDLLECTVIASRMLHGEIESIQVPDQVLDVLAQQVVAMVCDKSQGPSAILKQVRRAYPYRALGEDALTAVLEMLSGHYPSEAFADLRPRLSWDRSRDLLSPRRGTPMLVRMNAGTIPDRGLYTVHLGEGGPRVGELDEEMVFETRAGDRITLGASTWRVEGITRDKVVVSPDPGEAGRLPFWRGDGPGRPLELGTAIGAFLRKLARLKPHEQIEAIMDMAPVDRFAAGNLAAYVAEQLAHAGTVPNDQSICVERFRDELGDWRICILTPFGARIHAPWAMAIQRLLSASSGFEVQIMYTDDGIVLRIADAEELPGLDTLLPDPTEVRDLVTEQLADTALFAGLFRENAARSLLITRRRPGERSPLWAQRHKAQALLSTVRKYPAFPIVLETYRQALADVFDLPALEDLLGRIRSRDIRVEQVETASASPFARSLVFAYVAAYIYEADQPLAERRAQALTLDRNLLAELLGQAEFRELLDATVIDAVESELQGSAPDRQAADADELHDLLRRVGDLSEPEIALRCVEGANIEQWLTTLTTQRRAIALRIAGDLRYVAAEDAGLIRDTLGAMPPGGLPDAFVATVPAAMERVVKRYARTHGPFQTEWLANRYGLPASQMEPLLRALEQAGELLRGELRPGGAVPEWCAPDVLRRIKRQTLARLRNQIAAVESHALARFLPKWHGVGAARRGTGALAESVRQLEGLALPWSSLASTILPARVQDFSLDMLDMLCARGEIVWIGRGALGPRDGRVALYRREHAGPLLGEAAPAAPEASSPAGAIVSHLRGRGASFITDLESAVRSAHPGATGAEITTALWDLVWAGQITNDTFAPLRGLAAPVRQVRGRPSRAGSITAGGRWDLVESLIPASTPESRPREAAQTALARASMLLERYGVVSREAVSFEGLEGGFTPVYRSLSAMEDSGRIRRGFFVEDLSGAQFAYPGVVDRLRAQEDPSSVRPRGLVTTDAFSRADSPCEDTYAPPTPEVQALLAVDPANPFGALLPWPPTRHPDGRPRRVPGAWVFLSEGCPVLYLGAGAKTLLSFIWPTTAETTLDRDESHEAVVAVCLRMAGGLRRRSGRRGLLCIEKIDGAPVGHSDLAPILLRNGFVSDYRGYTLVESV